MRRRCNLISCDHDMIFPDNISLSYQLICPHCGHVAQSASEAIFWIRMKGRLAMLLLALMMGAAGWHWTH